METPGTTDEMPIPPPPGEPPPMQMPPAVPAYGAPAPPPVRAPGSGRRLLWYGAVLVAVVVALGGFGLLYNDDLSWQHQANSLRQQNASLQDQLGTAQSQASSAQQQVKDLQSQLEHPNLGIWNVAQQIDGPDAWLEGGIPDTFTYHLRATSTGPMSITIMTFDQYATAIECLDAGRGNAYQCLNGSGSVKSFVDVTSVNYDFHLAEGCAGYLAVWTARSTVTVHPDVSVTYNPAPTFTGAC